MRSSKNATRSTRNTKFANASNNVRTDRPSAKQSTHNRKNLALAKFNSALGESGVDAAPSDSKVMPFGQPRAPRQAATVRKPLESDITDVVATKLAANNVLATGRDILGDNHVAVIRLNTALSKPPAKSNAKGEVAVSMNDATNELTRAVASEKERRQTEVLRWQTTLDDVDADFQKTKARIDALLPGDSAALAKDVLIKMQALRDNSVQGAPQVFDKSSSELQDLVRNATSDWSETASVELTRRIALTDELVSSFDEKRNGRDELDSKLSEQKQFSALNKTWKVSRERTTAAFGLLRAGAETSLDNWQSLDADARSELAALNESAKAVRIEIDAFDESTKLWASPAIMWTKSLPGVPIGARDNRYRNYTAELEQAKSTKKYSEILAVGQKHIANLEALQRDVNEYETSKESAQRAIGGAKDALATARTQLDAFGVLPETNSNRKVIADYKKSVEQWSADFEADLGTLREPAALLNVADAIQLASNTTNKWENVRIQCEIIAPAVKRVAIDLAVRRLMKWDPVSLATVYIQGEYKQITDVQARWLVEQKELHAYLNADDGSRKMTATKKIPAELRLAWIEKVLELAPTLLKPPVGWVYPQTLDRVAPVKPSKGNMNNTQRYTRERSVGEGDNELNYHVSVAFNADPNALGQTKITELHVSFRPPGAKAEDFDTRYFWKQSNTAGTFFSDYKTYAGGGSNAKADSLEKRAAAWELMQYTAEQLGLTVTRPADFTIDDT